MYADSKYCFPCSLLRLFHAKWALSGGNGSFGTGRPRAFRRHTDGSKTIEMEAGERIMFAYPGEDFYANVKAERLPASSFTEEKHTLIAFLENYTKCLTK